jgi:hypothetical protein
MVETLTISRHFLAVRNDVDRSIGRAGTYPLIQNSGRMSEDGRMLRFSELRQEGAALRQSARHLRETLTKRRRALEAERLALRRTRAEAARTLEIARRTH